MAQCPVPVSNPQYSPPINYNSDLFGTHTSLNTGYSCDVQGGQYPYAEQDHLALRHLAFKNFIMPRTLDGKTVFKPGDEGQYSCDCNLSRTPLTAKYNSEALKFEVKSGTIKRGCDCIKRNGLQDRCPRIRHENRWECLIGTPHGCSSGAAKTRPLYANHLQRPTRPPYNNPCVSDVNLQRSRQVGSSMSTSCCNNRSGVCQPRSVKSHMLTNVGYLSGMIGNTSWKSIPTRNSACLPKNNNKTVNIVCSCRAC